MSDQVTRDKYFYQNSSVINKLCIGLCVLVLNACSFIKPALDPSTPEQSDPSDGNTRDTFPRRDTKAFVQLPAPADYPFVAVYFGTGSEAGLHLAASYDGYEWTEITDRYDIDFNPKTGPWGVFRDPSFDRGPDGTFHMTWTCGSNGFCYAQSPDLINWSRPKFIDIGQGTLGKRTPIMTWAPEVFYDTDRQEFVIAFAVANTHVPGLQTAYKGNFKSHFILTRDFETFSEPRLLLQPHPEIFDIDPALIKYKDGYMAFVKIESSNTTSGGKDGIHYATSKQLEGPWSKLSNTKLPNNQVNSEGPSPVKIGEEIIVYYDRPMAMQAARTGNLISWEDITHKLVVPGNFRHGTIRQINPLTEGENPGAVSTPPQLVRH